MMFGALARLFPGSLEPSAARPARRRRTPVRYGMEPLEGRSLLSVAAPAVVDQPPVLAAIATQSVEEGSTLALQATATDPNPGHTVTYSLDPGAPAGATINPSSGLLLWTPPSVQTYYSITVRATDSGPEALSAAETFTVMVFDVPPTVNAGINATFPQGSEFLGSGSFADPNPDTWTATVDYGDGSGVQPLALSPDKTFQLDHTYTTPGNYVVAVTIVDSQGGQGRGYFAVQVQPLPTASSTSSTPTATPTPAGSPQGQSTVTTVTVTAQSTPVNHPTGTTSHLQALLTSRAKHNHGHIPVHTTPNHKHY
jgi:hypothetical protein